MHSTVNHSSGAIQHTWVGGVIATLGDAHLILVLAETT